jgi:hypothetical protein
MFDMRNPAIILCDKDLEAALNMRALHVTEIRYRTSCTVPATYVTIFQDLPVLAAYTEMKFLDISLTKDSSLVLHAIQSPFYWRILEKKML